ncbi:unnamed protein product [Prunus brigantina]
MASLQTSTLIFSSSFSSSCCSSSRRSNTNAAIHVPKLPRVRFTVPKTATKLVLEGLQLREPKHILDNDSYNNHSAIPATPTAATTQLYAILEAVADRVEMHNNVREWRDNWNTLLLNSINMITLSASLMAGIAGTAAGAGVSVSALNISSTLLFSAASGMLLVMNMMQPSQLTEEQRNATRLFKQLQIQIQTMLTLHEPTEQDVKDTMEKVLALDKAYPLPLLGAMLEKFPKKFEPAVWWPKNIQSQKPSKPNSQMGKINGWSAELEEEMREIIEVVKTKDIEDYERLGSLVLKINKILAISGPLLTGVAAIGSAFVGQGSASAIVAVAAGSLASAVNAFQHGGQIGMVFEMYRNCAGFFNKLEDTIQATLEEQDLEKRENGELFEMKVAMQLGRSSDQLRELASKSASSRLEGISIDEFGCKLF